MRIQSQESRFFSKSSNDSALALFDELEDLVDLFGLRQFLTHASTAWRVLYFER